MCVEVGSRLNFRTTFYNADIDACPSEVRSQSSAASTGTNDNNIKNFTWHLILYHIR